MRSISPQVQNPFAFAKDDERGTNRLEGFSDGIFATAATLLIFSVALPETDGTAEGLMQALRDQGPIVAGLILSYILIVSTWASHHRLYRFIARTDHTLLVLNGVMLLSVVMVPFVTTLLATTLEHPNQMSLGAGLYGGIWTLGGIAYNATWWYAVRARLIDPAMPLEAIRVVTRYNATGPLIYATGLVASFIHPYIALVIYVLPAIFFLLPQRLFNRHSYARTKG